MNVPVGASSPVVAARRRERSDYQETLAAGLERNRRAVQAHAAGGGGYQAYRDGLTTRGHIWLLPPDSPLRRPWRDNMVGRPRTTSEGSDGASLKIMPPLNEEQLRQLRTTHAVTSADALPKDECAICYTHFELPLINQLSRQACIVRLPCGGSHVFHYRCVEPWLRKGRICPTCRQTVQPRSSRGLPASRGGRTAPVPPASPSVRGPRPPLNRAALPS